MALFKGDKMAYVLPMEESKVMNMLREKKGKRNIKSAGRPR